MVRDIFSTAEAKKPGVSPVKHLIKGKNPELYYKEYNKNYGYKTTNKLMLDRKKVTPKISELNRGNQSHSSTGSFERSPTGVVGSLDGSVMKPDFTQQSVELTETLAKLKSIRNGMKTLYERDRALPKGMASQNRSTSGTETCHDSN